MLKSAPLAGNFPIKQAFGDNPDLHRSVTCGGAPLRGHNGLDFDAPSGTPVLAVQDGVVLEARSDPNGFGSFVLLGHEWGQSLYGHLGQVNVGKGQNVAGGSQLGVSGASGQAAAPHLHFGMRIAPFSVGDGWCGYSDPAPYLARLTQQRGAIIGPHIIGGISQHIAVLRQWQPRVVLVLDPNPDQVRELRAACPDTVIIGRVFATDQDTGNRIRNNPREAAQWAHNLIMSRFAPEVDYWQSANEVMQTPDAVPLLSQFEVERMALGAQHGYKCAILGFSVGNPDLPENDRMAVWRTAYPAIEEAEKSGHIIALHQYGKPDLWGPPGFTDWLIYRLEHQVLRRLPYKKVQFAITEYGIDGSLMGASPAGWSTFTGAEEYVNQLLRSGRYVERFSGRVLGYAVFTLGHTAPWGSYDISGQAAQLLAERSERGTWSQVTTTGTGLGTTDTDTTTDPGGTPAVERPGAGLEPPASFIRRKSAGAEHMNLAIRSLDERPDAPGGEIVYFVKDIFTTQDGSWEPSDKQYTIEQWARDAYLKPFGAPDYFDDAGADHHLFAAVIGLDGQLMKLKDIQFWSDGFDKLGDPSYNGYVFRQTKDKSGWINIPIEGGSSFVPERGEMGPWCWVPTGAAEVVCGGGMPAKQHVSTFVVWQAFRRDELGEAGEEPDDGGDHNIFLPWVSAAPARAAAAQLPATPAPGGFAQAPSDDALRAAAWNRLGIEYDRSSPLAEYARRQGLGMPVTAVFEVEGIVAQGFYGGIVYARRSQPLEVAHLAW